jgi:hypothetical protein
MSAAIDANDLDESDDEAQFASVWVPDPVRLPLAASLIAGDADDADDAPVVVDANNVNSETSPAAIVPIPAVVPLKARLNNAMAASVESDEAPLAATYVCDKCKVCVEFVGNGTVCRGCGCELIHHLANESDDDSSNAFEYDSDGGHAGVDDVNDDVNDDDDDDRDDDDDVDDR